VVFYLGWWHITVLYNIPLDLGEFSRISWQPGNSYSPNPAILITKMSL